MQTGTSRNAMQKNANKLQKKCKKMQAKCKQNIALIFDGKKFASTSNKSKKTLRKDMHFMKLNVLVPQKKENFFAVDFEIDEFVREKLCQTLKFSDHYLHFRKWISLILWKTVKIMLSQKYCSRKLILFRVTFLLVGEVYFDVLFCCFTSVFLKFTEDL